MAGRSKPVKLLGSAKWTDADIRVCQVQRAILLVGKQLKISVQNGPYLYDFMLEWKLGDTYEGTSTCVHNGKTHTEPASGNLYSSASGYFFFGKWVEEGADYDWWADLQEVDRFPDEVREE